MRWLAWRQLRGQVLVTVAGLAVVAAFLVYLGLQMRGFVDDRITGCGDPQSCELALHDFQSQFHIPMFLATGLLLLTPALLGAFWGAPLIAREVETGTHRLVWSQSVTRTHWLAVKLAVVMLAGLVVSGAFAWLVTWTSAPYDEQVGSRFASFTFGARDLVPLGYAALGLAVGITLGLLIRRTVPALAATMAVMAVVQVAMPLLVRPHLIPAETSHISVDAASLTRIGGLFLQGDRLIVEDYVVPGAWVYSGTTPIEDANGKNVSPEVTKPCMDASSSPAGAGDCLAKLDLHFDVTYQPSSRYWPFQGLETGLLAVMTLALVGFCRWRIPRGIP